MKILHFGPAGGERTTFSLLGGLTNLGHEVKTCNIHKLKLSMSEKAEKAINEFKPDLIVTIGGWHQHFDAAVLWQIIKKHGLPHVYWAIEDPTFFDWSSTVHLSAYDFVFTVSEKCVPLYNQRGTPAAYLPQACNPAVHKRVPPLAKYRNDIIVLSNKYQEYDSERCAFRHKCYHDLVEPVLQAGYDIKIYGRGWDDGMFSIPADKLGGYVGRDTVPAIYSSAKLVLIIQWDYDGHICYKTFEALGCRCLQIAPYTPVQAKFFQHKQHLLYSRSPEETIHLVDYYLRNTAEREKIALQGQREAYKNHSLTVRARQALETLQAHGFSVDYIQKKPSGQKAKLKEKKNAKARSKK